ncbi:MAG: leucine-rich repeat protein [Clostridia bacterium]|nr:leucine-rich repeat protein [Clostridia bacterium]MBQ7046329.1 leucine-rich repeat protein [Oscillospiraceae bacterium]
MRKVPRSLFAIIALLAFAVIFVSSFNNGLVATFAQEATTIVEEETTEGDYTAEAAPEGDYTYPYTTEAVEETTEGDYTFQDTTEAADEDTTTPDVPSTTSGKCGENLTWNLDVETRELTISGTGYMDYDVVFNSTLKNFVESIVIQEGLTTITYRAFADFVNITSITIPNSVLVIDWQAFYGCVKLENINLPDNIGIGSNAFYNTKYYNKLENWENGVLYIGKHLVGVKDNEISTTYKIKDGTLTIAGSAFLDCSTITEITIPESVTRIGNSAFCNCENLLTVNFNATNCINTSSSNGTFYNCPNLKFVNIGDNVETIPYRLFINCETLTTVNIGAESKLKKIEEGAFCWCISLESIAIPNSVTEIDSNAFYECAKLTTIIIPENVTRIGRNAFYGCVNLEKVSFNATNCTAFEGDVESNGVFGCCYNLSVVSIGHNVETIPDRAFSRCRSLTTVNMNWNSNLKKIGKEAFYECISLEDIDVPVGVTEIDAYAFYDCHSLKFLTIYGDSNLEVVGERAFSGCSALEYIHIPESVRQINAGTFSGCSSLSEIIIPNNVESIGRSAFSGCINLSEIILPENIRNIGEDTFYNCTSLTEITIPENIEKIDEYAFSNCSSLAQIYYNAINCAFKDGTCFSGCSAVESLYIGEEVKNIPAYAFNGCTNLKNIYLPDTVINIDNSAFSECHNAVIHCKAGSYANDYAVRNGMAVALTDSANGTVFEVKNRVLYNYSGNAANIVLPSEISTVGYGAFKDNEVIETVEIPYCVSQINDMAFANCANLNKVIIPYTATTIGKDAFDGSDVTIVCYLNSYAYNYAVENNIPYELITVTLSASELSLTEGESATIAVTTNPVLSSGMPMIMRSNNNNVAIIDSNGNIKAVSQGSATVTVVSSNGECLASCSVDVLSIGEITIIEPDRTTVNYGDSIALQINIGNLPAGVTIEWKASNNNFEYVVSEDGKTCTITAKSSGETTFTITVVDSKGNQIGETATQKMTAKAGFFHRLVAFFKKLFGLTKAIPR